MPPALGGNPAKHIAVRKPVWLAEWRSRIAEVRRTQRLHGEPGSVEPGPPSRPATSITPTKIRAMATTPKSRGVSRRARTARMASENSASPADPSADQRSACTVRPVRGGGDGSAVAVGGPGPCGCADRPLLTSGWRGRDRPVFPAGSASVAGRLRDGAVEPVELDRTPEAGISVDRPPPAQPLSAPGPAVVIVGALVQLSPSAARPMRADRVQRPAPDPGPGADAQSAPISPVVTSPSSVARPRARRSARSRPGPTAPRSRRPRASRRSLERRAGHEVAPVSAREPCARVSGSPPRQSPAPAQASRGPRPGMGHQVPDRRHRLPVPRVGPRHPVRSVVVGPDPGVPGRQRLTGKRRPQARGPARPSASRASIASSTLSGRPRPSRHRHLAPRRPESAPSPPPKRPRPPSTPPPRTTPPPSRRRHRLVRGGATVAPPPVARGSG